MSRIPFFRAALAASACAVALSGCASAPWMSADPELDVRPVETAAEPAAASPVDRLYQSAVRAIEDRDYGLALERLQLARERAPDDVRVLNAMAVTYDKVGRFDLSARFYAEAEKLAPGSPVVSANLAYSHLMQQTYQEVRMASRPAEPAPASATPLQQFAELMRPVRTLKPAAAAPLRYAELMRPANTLKLARASGPAPTRVEPALVGRPLLLVDAGGTAVRVRTQLASLGWTVAAPIQRTDHVKASRILYAAQHERVAKALAKTLPFETALTVCQDDCQGVVLLLGENATWTG